MAKPQGGRPNVPPKARPPEAKPLKASEGLKGLTGLTGVRRPPVRSKANEGAGLNRPRRLHGGIIGEWRQSSSWVYCYPSLKDHKEVLALKHLPSWLNGTALKSSHLGESAPEDICRHWCKAPLLQRVRALVVQMRSPPPYLLI